MQKDTYVCSSCGSSQVQAKVWVNVNDEKITEDGFIVDREDTWCEACEEHAGFEKKE